MNPFDALRGFGRAILILAVLLIVGAFAAGKVFAATCNVTEFAERPPVTYQAAFLPALASYNITYTTSSVQGAVFQPTTALIRVTCDAIANVLVGNNPTAALTSTRITLGQTEYFVVLPSTTPPNYTTLRLAVIGP